MTSPPTRPVETDVDARANRIWSDVAERVRALLYARISNPQDREDLCHDTFHALRGALARSPVIGNERAFVLGIAQKLVLKAYRDGGRRRTVSLDAVEEPAIEPPQDQALLDSETSAALTHGLSALDEEDREILRLTYQEEMAAPEIARAKGRSPDWVRQRLHRARRKLRSFLEEAKGGQALMSRSRSPGNLGVRKPPREVDRR